MYILAGGRSSRFGSDKARAIVQGEPTLARVAQPIEPVAASITVVADRSDKYDDLHLRTTADEPLNLGPLGGLATALRDRGDGWIILVSCDLLTVEPRWFEQKQPAMQALLDRPEANTVAVDLPHDWPTRLQANRPEDLPA